jgi:MFS family permease
MLVLSRGTLGGNSRTSDSRGETPNPGGEKARLISWIRTQFTASPGEGAGNGSFASLLIRNYKVYFWGQVISIAGTWMQNTALGWLVLEISHSGTAVGVTLALRYLPILILGPYGGLLADRLNGRKLLFASQVFAAAVSASFAVVVLLHSDPLLVVDLLALALGLVNAFANPVQQTLINELVPRNLLPNAVALNSISGNVARVIGPLVSGAVIASIGIAWCFAIDSASFVAVMVSLAIMRREEMYPRPPAARGPGQLRAGFRYMLRTPTVLLPMAMVAVVGTFAWEFQVSLPLVAAQTFHGGAWSYGALLAATGVGATAAGLWIARGRTPTIASTALSAVSLGIALGLAAAAPTMWTELAILLAVGWCTVSFHVRVKSVLQLNSLSAMRGRVMAIWAVAWNGTTPIGGPVVGWLGQHFGARWSLVAGAVPSLLIGAYALHFARIHFGKGKEGTPYDSDLAEQDLEDDAIGLPADK